MPNIKKMKEKGDITGIIKLLNQKKLQTRLNAVNALVEIKHIDGLRSFL